jgi:sedoheptulokinase
VIEKANIEIKILPEIVPPGTIIGEFEDKCPVVCATGDNQASVIGSTRDIKNSIIITIGTGEQINIFSSENIKIKVMETRPYFDNGYIKTGASLCGGKAYDVLEIFLMMQ